MVIPPAQPVQVISPTVSDSAPGEGVVTTMSQGAAIPTESVVNTTISGVSSVVPSSDSVAAVEAAADASVEGVMELSASGELISTPTPKTAPPQDQLAAPSPSTEIESPSPEATPEAATSASPPTVVPTTPSATPTVDTTTQYHNLLEVLTAEFKLDKTAAEKISLDNITTGESIDSLLTKENLVSEEHMTQAKAKLNNVPFIALSEVGIYPEALNRLPEGVARNYKMMPFAMNKEEGTLSVGMVDPLNLSAIDFAQQKTGLRVLAYYAQPSELDRLLAEYYSQSLSTEVTAALEQTTQVSEAKKRAGFADLSKETIRQAPITKIVETVVTFAIKARASDVHIEPLEDHTRVRYRIDGILIEKLILPRSVHEAVVSRIKILSGLKIDEKRMPQDGRFNFSALDQEVDLRVSSLPTIHGEKIVMRLLKKDQKVPSMPELGLDGLALRYVQDAIKVPHGIILITGPTGSGKTTTLYSLLHVINSPRVNIVTLEDPVEYQIGGINQVQINPQAGLTFASGLRSFLRQDPNIIMVGEIRDSETAELAIQASLTGHLVFATLHTSSAAGALPRLMDMGAEPFLLASSMTMVIGQRVMRVINAAYKEEYTPEQAVSDDIKAVLGPRYDAWCKQKGKDPNKMTLMRPSSNRPQIEPEFKGRIAVFEVMKISEEIAKLILERKPATEMEKSAQRDGMLLMKQDGYIKALEGLTTIEEVLRVAQI
ncbi:Flp pilus assembly complex ATPase component TadA [Candidatus Woesebacteria bacterium]|nr:Flp pilus assembly complex ATPase component TadA [Candidatus Woesebacteria bacterium]